MGTVVAQPDRGIAGVRRESTFVQTTISLLAGFLNKSEETNLADRSSQISFSICNLLN